LTQNHAQGELLRQTIASIHGLDGAAVAAARQRQDSLTKPRGSLGVLEDVSVQLSGLAGSCPPPSPEPAAVAVFAADHGVYAQRVTPWPQEVTAQMVANFLAGGAVINAIAAEVGARVIVVDIGVAAELDEHAGLLDRKIRLGTADITTEPAMSREQAVQALEIGIALAQQLIAEGARCLVTGDMGIANTTASAALIAVFTSSDPSLVTGVGTGIDEATLSIKVDAVRRAVRLHQPHATDPIGVLSAIGGLEHAGLAGFILGAAAARVPIVLDGVIAGSAALAAHALAPASAAAMIAGHRSTEPGAAVALDHIGLRALVDLDLRLGEGSGAALALPLIRSAVRILQEVATFDGAGVLDKEQQGNEQLGKDLQQ
jgi:nicotinate-nucleotide--dimethylbenzimidazole phosphoribosyltransferase